MNPARPGSLHINTERTWRGGEKQTLSLVTGLLERGYPAELVCPPGCPLAERARDAGVTVHEIRMRGELDVLAILRIRKLLRRGAFDVCQMHTSHAHSLGVLARGLRKKPITIVNRRVDFSIHRKGMLGLNRIKYRYGVDRYIAISHAIKSVLVKDGVDADRIDVVHSGVTALPEPNIDRETLRGQLGYTDSHQVVGNVAHLAEHKGQRYLVEAVSKLRKSHPDLRCLIVGEGGEREDLEARIRDLDLADIVTLAGFQEDVAAYLHAMDVFVMPSMLEGLCTSILDALRVPLPVVGSRTGGIPEIIEHEVTGLLATPMEASELAEAIARQLDDPAAARDRASRGHQKVTRHFSVESMVEGTLDVYRRLLGQEGPSS